MSVSKSVLGLLTGVLVGRKLDPETRVTALVPELIGTAYEGASVRDLLDMRTGVAFDEDYLATSARSSNTGKQRIGTRSVPENCLPTCARSTSPFALRMVITAVAFTTSRRIATCWAGSSNGRVVSGSPT